MDLSWRWRWRWNQCNKNAKWSVAPFSFVICTCSLLAPSLLQLLPVTSATYYLYTYTAASACGCRWREAWQCQRINHAKWCSLGMVGHTTAPFPMNTTEQHSLLWNRWATFFYITIFTRRWTPVLLDWNRNGCARAAFSPRLQQCILDCRLQ